MSEDRRSFLKMFGLSSAVVATISVSKGTEIETISDPDAKPLARPLVAEGHYRLPLAEGQNTGFNHMDVVKGRLYSAQEFQFVESDKWHPAHRPPGSIGSCIQFFHYGPYVPWVPNNEQHATYMETNLYRAKTLDLPEAFAVQRVGLVFSPMCDPEDRARFIDQSELEVWIGQKNYFRTPLAETFAVGEPQGQAPFPEFPVKGMIDLTPLPLIIANQMSFYGQVITKPWEYTKKIRCWLVYEGLYARGAQ
jgi:hypothetical protein